MNWKNTNVHLTWAFATFVGFIVWNFSLNWGSQKHFTDSLSLAFGISSLIVGVYAIFQGLVTSNSASRTADSLRSSAEQVRDAAQRVTTASAGLSNKMEDLPDRFDQFEEKLAAISRSQTTPTSEEEKVGRAGEEATAQSTTLGGLLAEYVCVKAFETSKPFNTSKIFEDSDVARYFIEGYIYSLMDRKQVEATLRRSPDELTVSGLKTLKPEIVRQRLDRNKEKTYISKRVPLIDKYFQAD